MQTSSEILACGFEDPSAVCERVYEWTGNETLAGLSEWVIDRPFRVLTILVLGWFGNRLARRTIGALSDRIRTTPSHPRLRTQRVGGPGGVEMNRAESDRAPARAEAIESVLKSLVTVVIFAIVTLLVLGEFSINLAPLLAGAGVVGIAIGFGAQSIVGDFLSGIFMLIEDQYGIGDVIEIEGVTGEVENISLRTTKIRDVSGTVWHVPNGTIRKVGNHSQLWSNAVVDIAVSYDTDLRQAIAVMSRVADRIWDETHQSEPAGDVIEDPTVLGVQELGESAVILRLVAKTEPSAQWRVQRELRLRLVEEFEQAGITVPFPTRTIHLNG